MARFKNRYRCTLKRLPKVGDVIMLDQYGPARFVVVEARLTGGGPTSEMSGHSFYVPDGWKVTARKLYQDFYTYNPKGKLIDFFMSPGFCDHVDPNKVMVVDRMRQTFVPV
jgi:hypothetical protein